MPNAAKNGGIIGYSYQHFLPMSFLRMDRRFILVPLLIIFQVAVCAVAQSRSVRGSVVERKGAAPVPGAHVVALSLPDSAVSAYAITDKDGRFLITNAPASPCLVRVSCLGYATKFTTLKSLPAADVRVELEPKAFDLAEVAVRKRAPGAVVKGDTVKFNVAKYVDGTEQVLGEVLEKLPGVEVDENGGVLAGGKRVDKLLLNGRDFAGERHDMLTKNLPSDMVGKVELIKNYNEYSQLDGFQSKGTAMNIGVDSAYMRRLTGNAELWGGFRDKYRAKANLFSIGDEVMLGLNAKAFNTGEEAMSLIDYLELCGGVKNFAQAISGRTSAVERPIGSKSPYLSPDESTRRRDDQIATANVAWNPSESLKINSYIVFNREGAKAQSSIARTLLAQAAAPVSLTEERRTANAIVNLCADVKYVTPREGILAYRGSAAYSSSDDDSFSDLRGRQQWAADGKSFHTEHDLSFTRNLGRRRLLTVRAYALTDRGDASAALVTDSLLLPIVASGEVSQDEDNDVDMFGASAAFVSKVGSRLRLKAYAAFDFDRVGYVSESDASELRTARAVARCSAYTLGLLLQKSKGLLQFSLGAQAVHVDSRASRIGWKLLPQASLDFELSSTHSFSISYESSLARDGGVPFASTARMADYRTLAVYAEQDEMLHLSQSIALNYTVFDPLSDVSCTLSAGLSSEADPVESDNRPHAGGGLLVEHVEGGKDDLFSYANVDFRKGLSIPLSLKLKGLWTHSCDADLYDGIRSNSVVDNVKSHLEIDSKFRTPVNFGVGGSLGWRRIDMGMVGGVSLWRSYTLFVQPVVVSSGQRFMLKIPVSYVADRASSSDVDYVDLGLSVSVKASKSLTLFSEGRDILHSDSRDRVAASQADDHVDVAVESRMPGFVIAGLKFVF